MRLGRGAVARAALSAALALGVVVTATAGAADGVIGCGSVMTEDTVLTRDLRGCESGLIIAAAGETLDLNGHSISGAGVGAGVSVSDIADQATIKNGSVSGLGGGIGASGSGFDFPSFRLESMRVVGNGTGVEPGTP